MCRHDRYTLLLVALGACSGPRAAPPEDPPHVRVQIGDVRAAAQRVVERLAGTDRYLRENISTRFLSDDIAIVTAYAEAEENEAWEDILVVGDSELELSPDVLSAAEREGECAGEPTRVEVAVTGDPRSGIAVLAGGRRQLLFTVVRGTLESESVECADASHVPGTVRIVPSVCGQIAACELDGISRALLRIDDARIAGTSFCTDSVNRLERALRDYVSNAPQRVYASVEEFSPDPDPNQPRGCALPSERDVARARAAIVRAIAAAPGPDLETGAPMEAAEVDGAIGRARPSCRHPRARTFALSFDTPHYRGVWWIEGTSVRPAAQASYGMQVVEAWTDLDGDGVEEVAVATADPGAECGTSACESTLVLSGSWPFADAPRLSPCATTMLVHPTDGRALYGEGVIWAWQGALVRSEAGFAELRAALADAASIRGRAGAIMSRLIGQPGECSPALAQDIARRLEELGWAADNAAEWTAPLARCAP